MSDKPFIAILNEQHGEARWSGYRLTVLHPGKLVKASDKHRVITEDEGMPFTNCIFITASLDA